MNKSVKNQGTDPRNFWNGEKIVSFPVGVAVKVTDAELKKLEENSSFKKKCESENKEFLVIEWVNKKKKVKKAIPEVNEDEYQKKLAADRKKEQVIFSEYISDLQTEIEEAFDKRKKSFEKELEEKRQAFELSLDETIKDALSEKEKEINGLGNKAVQEMKKAIKKLKDQK